MQALSTLGMQCPPSSLSILKKTAKKSVRRVMRACGCIEFYKSPFVPGAPKLFRQLLPRALQWMKGLSSPPHWGTPPAMCPSAGALKICSLSKSDGNPENKFDFPPHKDISYKEPSRLSMAVCTFFLASKMVYRASTSIWPFVRIPVPLPQLWQYNFFVGPCGESDQGTDRD